MLNLPVVRTLILFFVIVALTVGFFSYGKPSATVPSSAVVRLPWSPALRPIEDFHQDQNSVPDTGPVECVSTTAVVVRNIMNEYLANLSDKPPKPDLTITDYVIQLDELGDQAKKYRYPSHEPPVDIPLIGPISRAGWMYPTGQMPDALKQFASEFEQYYGCSYTVEQSSWHSYQDIAQEVRKGNLVIIHMIREPAPNAPGQAWIGGNPHTLGPVIQIDDKEITLIDPAASDPTGLTIPKTTTMTKEQFMAYWSKSSQFRVPLPLWLAPPPDNLHEIPIGYAYTPPNTMTVIIPDRVCAPVEMSTPQRK